MKAAILSDIHLDYNEGQDVLDCIAHRVNEEHAEVILLAGDISPYVDTTLQAVKELEALAGMPVYYVPGNHDLWKQPDRPDEPTDAIYEKFAADPHCLVGKSVRLGAHRLLGEIGWYDYSFGDSSFSKEEFDRMTYGGRRWQDSLFNDWTADNLAAHQRFLSILEERMQQFPAERLVVMTHMLPIADFTVPTTDEKWRYFNAFLGSAALGALFTHYPVDAAICGHVHYRQTIEKNGIRWFCRCLNYQTEWRAQEGNCCALQVADTIDFFEL